MNLLVMGLQATQKRKKGRTARINGHAPLSIYLRGGVYEVVLVSVAFLMERAQATAPVRPEVPTPSPDLFRGRRRSPRLRGQDLLLSCPCPTHQRGAKGHVLGSGSSQRAIHQELWTT